MTEGSVIEAVARGMEIVSEPMPTYRPGVGGGAGADHVKVVARIQALWAEC